MRVNLAIEVELKEQECCFFLDGRVRRESMELLGWLCHSCLFRSSCIVCA